jgi:SAM-dependent methyltransferase
VGFYDDRLLPWVVTFACGGDSIARQRRTLIPRATGRVLEVGLGAGFNLPLYDAGRIEELVGLEPSAGLLARARRRAERLPFRVALELTTLEGYPDTGAAFDTVVFTYTLCSVGDAARVLAMARRLLRPDGRLLFCEHGRAPEAWVRRVQRALQPAWGYFGGNCQLGRDVPALLQQAGFVTGEMTVGYTSAFKPASYTYWGTAAKG